MLSNEFCRKQTSFDRNLTFIDHVSQLTAGVRMVTCIAAGIRNRFLVYSAVI